MEVTLPIENLKAELEVKKTTNSTTQKRWTAVLYLSGIVSISALLTAFILYGIAYYEKVEETSNFNKIASLSVVAALLLMMVGAHALDKISESQI